MTVTALLIFLVALVSISLLLQVIPGGSTPARKDEPTPKCMVLQAPGHFLEWETPPTLTRCTPSGGREAVEPSVADGYAVWPIVDGEIYDAEGFGAHVNGYHQYRDGGCTRSTDLGTMLSVTKYQ